ncbi:hypothetical protein EMIHUDRAFT_258821 [Emiliania huxleyi CCMP1516]|uniref:Uncharacterized protein n=2 Tax=Emiliania huxleyi TaxID=2903 RepID=A0A0D3I5X0_EMIH1|nr:hypothetical protein EMIHUDRAFT_258821 [Emiliania huxleyi CCMP1516]EOD06655.1 hypothetical protein EMIHUDRAFT_258821 [Emiliania huxleyi CCMP1516]|eukprot:XP_005759084.1 hypothetical protein EMIHUDRAFT_258821 [Emiliania huxleyi CCMP1516]
MPSCVDGLYDALRLLEPRLVCRLVDGVAGGRLSLPPPRESLVSLFVYSSLVSCAASWAAWRAGGCVAGGRLSLPPPRVSLVSLFVYSSLVSCAASWAAWRGGRLSLPPPRVSLVSL